MHLTTLLGVLLLAVPDAGVLPSGPVYITGSSVNLRAEPSAQGKKVKQLPIATECQVAEQAPDGWARVRCGELTGWTRAELLSPTRPTLEPLLARAEDKALPAKDRLEAALRAAALSPSHPKVDSLVRETFFAAEWKNLEATLAKGTSASHYLTSCSTSAGAPLDAAVCAVRALEYRREVLWHRIEVDRKAKRFVSITPDKFGGPSLEVRLGTYSGEPDELTVSVVAEGWYPADTLAGPLERTPTPWERQLVEDKRLSAEWLRPKLSEAALAALESVVGEWHFLHESREGPFLRHYCSGADPGVYVRIHAGTAKLSTQDRVDSYEYVLTNATRRKDGSVTLETEYGKELTFIPIKGERRLARFRGSITPAGDKTRYVHDADRGSFPTREEEKCEDEP